MCMNAQALLAHGCAGVADAYHFRPTAEKRGLNDDCRVTTSGKNTHESDSCAARRCPNLFGAISCEVPLLDMKRYSHLSAGASWMAEYGNLDTADWDFHQGVFAIPQREVRRALSAGAVLHDDRVGSVQARKMAAKMIDMKLPDDWFYENLEGGYAGGADNRQAATMHALAYDFLWYRLQ